MKKQVSTPNAPQQSVRTLRLSRLATPFMYPASSPSTPRPVLSPANDIASQTKQSLENIKAILEFGGLHHG